MDGNDYETHKVVLRRQSNSAGQYFTLCLPFDIDAPLSATYPDIETAATPTGQIIHNTGNDSYILILKEYGSDDKIPAGTPVLIKLKDGVKNIGFTNNSTFNATQLPELKSTKMSVLDWDGKSGFMTVNNTVNITYNGCFDPVSNSSKNIWSFNGDGSFGPHSGSTLNAFRMYLTIDPITSAKINSISIGDMNTTGISSAIMEQPTKTDKAIYTTDGRLVNKTGSTEKLTKGLYIQGGKKLIVR